MEHTHTGRPNILWYCTDQQRYDTIRCLGNKYINTPNIDRLAAKGTAFRRAYTQSPICTPSRASFLTGRYPASHQVQRNGTDRFPSHERLVTKILAESGYDCGLIGKLHLARAKGRTGEDIDHGYRYVQWSHHPQPWGPSGNAYGDWLEQEKGVRIEDLWAPLKGNFYRPGVPEEYHQTTWCTEKAMEFISEKRNGPWLLSMNPFDPHPPFDPPKEYLDRYNPQDMPFPLFRESDIERQNAFHSVDLQSSAAVNPMLAVRGDPPADPSKDTASRPPASYNARKIIAAYYGMIELIDRQFGRLVDFLAERGELENTLIIFTSDHGELLGDHGLLYKGCRFFEGLVHVPLIISWPQRFRADLRSQALVELLDLPETLLDAAGLPIPDAMQGKSLFPILTGESEPELHKPYVVSEYFDATDLPLGSHGSMYFDGRYKSALYHDAGLCEIFDLQEDPGEFTNRAEDPGFTAQKAELIEKHCNAMMGTVSAGIPRSDSY
jgi:arylsulfatase A-like enzyme